jgi:hypothetical protein
VLILRLVTRAVSLCSRVQNALKRYLVHAKKAQKLNVFKMSSGNVVSIWDDLIQLSKHFTEQFQLMETLYAFFDFYFWYALRIRIQSKDKIIIGWMGLCLQLELKSFKLRRAPTRSSPTTVNIQPDIRSDQSSSFQERRRRQVSPYGIKFSENFWDIFSWMASG